jgi:signal transduction histidine kinase
MRRLSIAPTKDRASRVSIRRVFSIDFIEWTKQGRANGATRVWDCLSRWAIEAHGGDLTLKSEEGQGATFRISLPLANNPSSNQGKGGLQ